MKSLFLVLVMCFSVPVMAQDFNLDDFVPITDEVEQVQSEVQPVVEPVVEPNLDAFDISDLAIEDDSKARLDEIRKLADEIKAIGEQIKLDNESSKVTKMTLNDSQVLSFEERLSTLEKDSLNYVTREEVTGIVKEEVQKYVKLTIKSGTEVKNVNVPLVPTKSSVVYNSVAIPGYSGSFDVPVGGVITHIDGVPVGRTYGSRDVKTIYSGNSFLQGSRLGNGWRVQVAQPTGCTMVNGIMQCN
jgi:hypothetical protein